MNVLNDRVFAIDQGNSQTKVAVFKNDLLEERVVFAEEDPLPAILSYLKDRKLRCGIYSSVKSAQKLNFGSEIDVVQLSDQTRFPIKLDYETPATLGLDRIANAVGASVRFGGGNILVVDFGTCITYSLVCDNSLIGGAISPGIELRFKALHHFTGGLPHIPFQPAEAPSLVGRSTDGSIRAGVQLAAVFECDAMIDRYCSAFAHLRVIGTGGMLSYFEKHLKSTIFADPDLTLQGLYEIYKYGQS